MKKVLLLVAFFATMSLSAQSLREIEAIKKSDEYVCAEGVGKTLEEADQDAYNRLLKSSALVSHVSSYSTEQTMSTDGNTSSSQYSDNITIQSSLFIQNAKRYDYAPGRDGSYRVLRYIHKSDWEHRYDECKNRIKDNIEAALYNLELNNIEDALMYYTWAAASVCLLCTCCAGNFWSKERKFLSFLVLIQKTKFFTKKNLRNWVQM